MKCHTILFLLIFFVLPAFSCSENNDQNSPDSTETQKTATDTLEKLSGDNKTIVPVSREDSAQVYTYEQLSSFLPEVSGYKKGLVGGETLSSATSGGRQSYVRQEYDHKNRKIILVLTDYSIARESLQQLASMFEANTKVANQEVVRKKEGFQKKEARAYSEIHKETHYPTLNVILYDRYIISVSGNPDTNIEFLKKIASSIALEQKSST